MGRRLHSNHYLIILEKDGFKLVLKFFKPTRGFYLFLIEKGISENLEERRREIWSIYSLSENLNN